MAETVGRLCEVDGCGQPHRARGLCSSHYNQAHQPNRHRNQKVAYKCDRCGSECLKPPTHHKRYAAVYCSLACRDAGSRDKKQLVLAGPVRRAETLAFRAAAMRVTVAAVGSRSRNVVWVGAECGRCGLFFVCMWTGPLPRYCSRSCGRSTSKTRRRQLGGERVPYRRQAIFERDRWTCRLCGKRVRRFAKVPDPKAPVIDHIVPLAAGPDVGGVDAPWNVQCAHFMCNSFKSATFMAAALF